MLTCNALGKISQIKFLCSLASRWRIFFLKPDVHITAWVALTVSDDESVCMQIIPASNKNLFFEQNDEKNPENMTPRGQGLASKIDTSEAARMPLYPG